MKTAGKIYSRPPMLKNDFSSVFCLLRWSSASSLCLRQGAEDRLKTKNPFNNESAARKRCHLSLRVFCQKLQFRIQLRIKKLMQSWFFSKSNYVLFYLSRGCDWDFVELHGAVYPFIALENRSCKIPNGKKIEKNEDFSIVFPFFLMAYWKYIVSATLYSYLIVSDQFKVCIMDWFSTSLFFV